MKLTLSKGGTKERTVEINKLRIPDLWHIASAQDSVTARESILETWHIAHDLLRTLAETEETRNERTNE